MEKNGIFQLKILRPTEKGVKKALYDLEADIMELLWSSKPPEFTVRDVLSQLKKNRRIAYTTVMTTIDRLWRNGLLDRDKEGKTYLYSVKISKNKFLRSVTAQIISSIPAGFNESLFSHFVQIISQSDIERLDRLEKLLDTRRQQISS